MRTVTLDFESPDARFKVLLNAEEQYSLWPADLPVPGGWSETGVLGSPEECDAYVERVWTDLRPKSVRVWMERTAHADCHGHGTGLARRARPAAVKG
jgi:MbtH protein